MMIDSETRYSGYYILSDLWGHNTISIPYNLKPPLLFRCYNTPTESPPSLAASGHRTTPSQQVPAGPVFNQLGHPVLRISSTGLSLTCPSPIFIILATTAFTSHDSWNITRGWQYAQSLGKRRYNPLNPPTSYMPTGWLDFKCFEFSWNLLLFYKIPNPTFGALWGGVLSPFLGRSLNTSWEKIPECELADCFP